MVKVGSITFRVRGQNSICMYSSSEHFLPSGEPIGSFPPSTPSAAAIPPLSSFPEAGCFPESPQSAPELSTEGAGTAWREGRCQKLPPSDEVLLDDADDVLLLLLLLLLLVLSVSTVVSGSTDAPSPARIQHCGLLRKLIEKRVHGSICEPN